MASLLLIALCVYLCNAAEIPSVKLLNAAVGNSMPVAGIGTGAYGVPGETWNDDISEQAIAQWLKLGGRRVDGAKIYGDQVGVGKAIKASGLPRSEIFMTSKIPLAGYNKTLSDFDEALKDLQMDYVDLLLIHWPGPGAGAGCEQVESSWKECRLSCWKALEQIYNQKKAMAIGVSNYEQNHLQEIIDQKGLIPSVNQVEFHPFWHEGDLLAFCKTNKILFNGYAPLGAPDWATKTHSWDHNVLQDATVNKIAKAHQRTPAQVVQRWEWQQGIVVNPRTWNVTHMKENLNFFDFELSEEEMNKIATIKVPPHPKVCGDPHNIK